MSFGEQLKAIGINKDQPWRIIFLLFFAVLNEFMIITVSGSFLPHAVKYFGVPWQFAGRYVGATFGAAEIGRSLSCFYTAFAIKRFGARRMFILMNLLQGATTILFGFSWNLGMLIGTRILVGLSTSVFLCTNVLVCGISNEDNQTYIITWVLTCTGSVGVIVGPALGGYLSLPTVQYPETILDNAWFEKFPILMPNVILGVCMFLVAYGGYVWLPRPVRVVKSMIDLDNEATSLISESHNKSTLSGKNDTISGASYLIRNRSFVLATIISSLYCCVANGLPMFVPLWLQTPASKFGMGFKPHETSLVFLATGIFQLVFELLIVGAVNKKLRAKRSFYMWSVIQMFLVAALCSFRALGNTSAFKVCMSFYFGVISVTVSGGWTSVYIFLNNSVTENRLAVALGCATTLRFFYQGATHLIIGAIYSASVRNESTNEEYLLAGFPFNHHLIFYLLSMQILLACSLAVCIREDIDRRAKN